MDGLCCDAACDAASCDTCSIFGDLTYNTLLPGQAGTCRVVDGASCDDGNACTKADLCEAGLCMGGDKIQCPQADACHEAVTCDALIGECPELPAKPDGTFCDTGDPCTADEHCVQGECVYSDVLCECGACGVYKCKGKAHQCLSSCSSVEECALGYVCDRNGACILPPPRSGTLDRGCSIEGGQLNGQKSRFPWLALVGFCSLAFVIRRPRPESTRESASRYSRRA